MGRQAKPKFKENTISIKDAMAIMDNEFTEQERISAKNLSEILDIKNMAPIILAEVDNYRCVLIKGHIIVLAASMKFPKDTLLKCKIQQDLYI